MGLRTLARTVAKNKSYKKCGTTDMFGYFFTKEWREKRQLANANKTEHPGHTKKRHKANCISGKEK